MKLKDLQSISINKIKYKQQEQKIIKMIDRAITTSNVSRFPLSPSQALKCARMLYYSLKHQTDPQTYPHDFLTSRSILTFDAGHRAEWSLIKFLRRSKEFDIIYEQKIVKTGEIAADVPILGTIDLVIGINNTKILVDIKSINQEGFKNSELPKPEHFIQVQMYLNSSFAKENNIKYGGILYYNKNMCQLKFTMFDKNSSVVAPIIERFKQIYNHFKTGVVPPREFLWGYKEDVSYSQCGYCPFNKLCYQSIADLNQSQPEFIQPVEITDKKIIDKLLTLLYSENTDNERQLIEFILMQNEKGQIFFINNSKKFIFIVYKIKSGLKLKYYMEK